MKKKKRSPLICYYITDKGERMRVEHRGKYRSCPWIAASRCHNKSCELAGLSLLNHNQ